MHTGLSWRVLKLLVQTDYCRERNVCLNQTAFEKSQCLRSAQRRLSMDSRVGCVGSGGTSPQITAVTSRESIESCLERAVIAQVSKESACSVGDPDSVPESERSLGGGNGNPFQYSCLENPMDRGAWWATVHGVAKSWT